MSKTNNGTQPEMEITIASVPDREHLVATISYGMEQWAELNVEKGWLGIEIYPHSSGEPWVLPFAEVIEALNEARHRLLGE